MRGLRCNNHFHQTIVADVWGHIQDDADILIRAVYGRIGGGAVADCTESHPGGEINTLADHNLRQLSVTGQNGGTRKHLGFASRCHGPKRA